MGKAKGLIAKVSGAEKPKEELPKNKEEHDIQVNTGLAALDKEQQKDDKDHNGALTRDEAVEAAQKVKAAYPVFKSITPVEHGGRWVFEYVGSGGKLVGYNVDTNTTSNTEKVKYRRNRSERRKALLRDANDPRSDLSEQARDFINQTGGYNVPEGYEVSHEIPLYTEKTSQGKEALDKADNMKTVLKKNHREKHIRCGDTYHEYPR